LREWTRARGSTFLQKRPRERVWSKQLSRRTSGCAGSSSSFSPTKHSKGGFSSKEEIALEVFHALNRFSEDIDLAVDYVALGFTGNKDPREEKHFKDEVERDSRRDDADMFGLYRGRIPGNFEKTVRRGARRARWMES